MRQLPLILLVAIISFIGMISFWSCVGTQMTPEKSYLAASESFNMLVEQYNGEKEKQSVEVYNQWVDEYDPLLLEGKVLLDTWGMFVKIGNYEKSETSAKEFMDFKDALIDLLAIQVFKEEVTQ
jgi:hypothetical protein